MLYTPTSLQDVDDGFDDASFGAENADFQLLPNISKNTDFQPLFGNDVPSADLGFSQTTQPEMFQHLDLNTMGDFTQFQD